MSVEPTTSTAAVPAPGTTLPCGTAVDVLVDQVQAGRAPELSEHQRGCEFCRAVLAHYTRVFAPLRTMAQETVRAPRSTVDDALAVLGSRGRPVVPPWLVDATGGRTRVGERVVVACARRAAERVPGVRAALVRATAAGEGDAATLDVVLAAAYGADLRALGERVRRVVADEVAARTGVVPASVSALVDTVVE